MVTVVGDHGVGLGLLEVVRGQQVCVEATRVLVIRQLSGVDGGGTNISSSDVSSKAIIELEIIETVLDEVLEVGRFVPASAILSVRGIILKQGA